MFERECWHIDPRLQDKKKQQVTVYTGYDKKTTKTCARVTTSSFIVGLVL